MMFLQTSSWLLMRHTTAGHVHMIHALHFRNRALLFVTVTIYSSKEHWHNPGR
jgi:hypothetical protein